MKKTIRRMLTVCGAAAMMLSAAQIIAFADGGRSAYAHRL